MPLNLSLNLSIPADNPQLAAGPITKSRAASAAPGTLGEGPQAEASTPSANGMASAKDRMKGQVSIKSE